MGLRAAKFPPNAFGAVVRGVGLAAFGGAARCQDVVFALAPFLFAIAWVGARPGLFVAVGSWECIVFDFSLICSRNDCGYIFNLGHRPSGDFGSRSRTPAFIAEPIRALVRSLIAQMAFAITEPVERAGERIGGALVAVVANAGAAARGRALRVQDVIDAVTPCAAAGV